MRYGYSLLLREFVAAEEVEYGDCEHFQIACPVCREPVFKKTRAARPGETTHFLSHYKAETEEEKDCELRVAHMASEHVAPFNAEGRKQTLQRFLLVLRDAIARVEERIFPTDGVRGLIDRVMTRPAFEKEFYPLVARALDAMAKLPNAREMITGMIAGFPDFESRSLFWHRRQAAYVLDILEHLTTPQARDNRRYLAAAALVHIALKADEYRRHIRSLRASDIMVSGKRYDPLPAVDWIEALVRGKSQAALDKIADRAAGADKLGPGASADIRPGIHNLLAGVVGEVVGPAIGILASVPFPEIARGREVDRPAADALMRQFMDALSRAAQMARERQSKASA